MRGVCETFAKAGQGSVPRALDGLAISPIQTSLVTVAETFLFLQDARHRADYDLDGHVSTAEAETLCNMAARAFHSWDSIRAEDNSRVMLLAFSFADRWTRRG